MKILHINTNQEGGAALCAMRINDALRSEGVDSKMIFASGEKGASYDVIEKSGYRWSRSKIIRSFQVLLNRVNLWPKYSWCLKRHYDLMMKTGNRVQFSSLVTLYFDLIEHPWVKQADIIHLHWVAGFIDYPSFFTKIDKPIVWTLHDENPGLGGFHYSSTKKRNDILDYEKFDNHLFALKKKFIAKASDKIHLVALSTEMHRFIDNNEILRNCKSSIIHNGVDISVFKLKDKVRCRKSLGWKESNEKIFLFSSFDLEDKRKGLELLIVTLKEIAKFESVKLVCLGNYNEKYQSKEIDIVCPGFISDNELLSSYYSAADYFVLSSFQEAFAQTPLEAMACGTPVVAFPCSGVNDLLNEECGVVCEDFTVSALYNGIVKMMKKDVDSQKIREYISKNFASDVIASQYITLYQSILNK